MSHGPRPFGHCGLPLLRPTRTQAPVIADCQWYPGRQWATSEAPQDTALPEPYGQSLNSFQKMLILKIFREEKLVHLAPIFEP